MKRITLAFLLAGFVTAGVLNSPLVAQPVDNAIVVTQPATGGATVVEVSGEDPVVVTDDGETTVVTIPWGKWLGDLLGGLGATLGGIAVLILTYLMRNLPAGVVQIIRTFQVEQLVSRSIDAAVRWVAEAVKGRTLELDVGSTLIARAINNVLAIAPKWLVDWMGGVEGIREKIYARLEERGVVINPTIPGQTMDQAVASKLEVTK
jgi:hypothetical protein